MTRPDRSTADVRLDSTYRPVAVESDQEHADGPVRLRRFWS